MPVVPAGRMSSSGSICPGAGGVREPAGYTRALLGAVVGSSPPRRRRDLAGGEGTKGDRESLGQHTTPGERG
jgi:hypothetical protein